MTKLQAVILETIESNQNRAHWSQIVEAVKTKGFKIKNWMKVRGELQGLLNDKIIFRENNTTIEVYSKTTA
jgi:hypothetical protein